MNKSLKFIYFDVGGVLLFDYSKTNKWERMKKDLGVTEKNNQAFENIWKEHKDKIGIDCDIDTLIPLFKKKAKILFPKNYSMLEDFVDRFNFNPSIWPVVEYAKKHYKLGLLTNQYPRMLPLIRKRKLIPNIDWNVVIDSSIVGYQKPESKIYEIAEAKSKTIPAQILFIDNRPKNLVIPKKRGWQTYLYDLQFPEKSSKNLLNLLNDSLE